MFLVRDQRSGASRFPYHVQGQAMCPVRWSLKNQRTAQPLPIADIHRRIGISMCMIGAAGTGEAVSLSTPECPATVTTLARIGSRDMLDNYPNTLGLVRDELLQLESRPEVPVVACIGFGVAALLGALAYSRQIFQSYASAHALREGYYVLRETVIDVCHHAPLAPLQLLHGTVFSLGLKFLPSGRIDTSDMADTLGLVEDDGSIRGCSRHGDIVPTINTDPAACWLSVGNLHRHRETGIPDTLARAPELQRSGRGFSSHNGIEPRLLAGLMHGQRHTFLDATTQAKAQRVGVTDLVQGPVLVVGLQRQTAKLLDLGARIGIANGLIDPGRANCDIGKRFARECSPLRFGQCQQAIGHCGIERLQARKLVRLGAVQLEKRQFEGTSGSAHMYNFISSCAALQDKPVAARWQQRAYIPGLNAGALRTVPVIPNPRRAHADAPGATEQRPGHRGQAGVGYARERRETNADTRLRF